MTKVGHFVIGSFSDYFYTQYPQNNTSMYEIGKSLEMAKHLWSLWLSNKNWLMYM